MTVLSKSDLRTLAAAQIAAAMMAAGDRDPGEDVIRNRADVAVKIAKAIEEAVTRSLEVEPPAGPSSAQSVPIGKLSE